ncbi:hypothetical protein [Nonomuraea diastatica]|uniref:hypothetical protein n=1 Tax=Nonomuraea diastatica TaxID=1848329 RepID=UPI001407E0BC|nr:hypothetical protein [Nonomuraea diastatica]
MEQLFGLGRESSVVAPCGPEGFEFEPREWRSPLSVVSAFVIASRDVVEAADDGSGQGVNRLQLDQISLPALS